MLPKLVPRFITPPPRRFFRRASPVHATSQTPANRLRTQKKKSNDLCPATPTTYESSEAIKSSAKLTPLRGRENSDLNPSKYVMIKRDPSIFNFGETSLKRKHKLLELKQEFSLVKEARLQRESKRILCKALESRYNVSLPYTQLSCLSQREILEHAQGLWRSSLGKRTCLQMKLWLLQTLSLRSVETEQARVHIAAFTIQLYWRRYKVSHTKTNGLALKHRQKRVQAAAVTIQRMYRGYR